MLIFIIRIKKTIVFILFIILLLPIVGGAQTINGSFMHNGLNRTYEVYIPLNYSSSTALPLVMNFHGFGGNGVQHSLASNFKPMLIRPIS